MSYRVVLVSPAVPRRLLLLVNLLMIPYPRPPFYYYFFVLFQGEPSSPFDEERDILLGNEPRVVEEEDGEELFGDNMERYGCSLIRVIIKFLRELIFMVLKLCTL